MLETQGLKQAEFSDNYVLFAQIFIYSSVFPEEHFIILFLFYFSAGLDLKGSQA